MMYRTVDQNAMTKTPSGIVRILKFAANYGPETSQVEHVFLDERGKEEKIRYVLHHPKYLLQAISKAGTK